MIEWWTPQHDAMFVVLLCAAIVGWALGSYGGRP